jgi:4-hydroxythreonine-4-phosphate dehydrogenase
MANIKIGISIGDVNGIGLEVIIKTLANPAVFKHFTPIIYGSPKVVSYHKNIVGLEEFPLNIISTPQQAQQSIINIIPCWQENINISLGIVSQENSKYTIMSLTQATADLKNGFIHALVTAPINKQAVYSDDFPYRGHTEYFAKEFNSNYLMLMVHEDLKIGIVTGHVPLNEVAGKLTKELVLEKIKLLDNSLKKDFGFEKGKIAVLGLNPHAGDGGIIGKEEETIIGPAISEAKNKGIFAFGPYSSDGFFGTGQHRKFDAVLAMYHDQGLIPFKTLAFTEGVNYSAGMPFIRTSPDHGTGYDIAGKNEADETSFRNALFLAYDIIKARKSYEKDHINPIVKKERHFEDEVVKDES